MASFGRGFALACVCAAIFAGCGDDEAPPGADDGSGGIGGSAGTSAGAGSGGRGGTSAAGGSAGHGGRGGTGGDAGGGEAGDRNRGGSAGTSGNGGSGEGGDDSMGGAAGDSGGSGGEAGDGTGGDPPLTRECDTVADCDRTRGASPCGAWECTSAGTCVASSPGCTDADGDGYGVGASCACAGIDCDDEDAGIGSVGRETCSLRQGTGGGCISTVKLCYAGVWGECKEAPGEVLPGGEACNGEDDDCDGEIDEDLGVFSCGLGACRTVVPACTAGVIRRCEPRAPTTTVDGCNGIDDDCDGSTDEDCDDCIRVSPAGDDDAAALNAGAMPFRNLQPAIDFANTHRAIATRVCVAAGPACGASATYPGPAGADLVMRNGISVHGGYESTTWTRCADSTTRITPATARGVYFPPSIDDPTALDGFTIDRFAATTTAGVTLDDAQGVWLAHLDVRNAVAAERSYGVNATNDSDATIVESVVNGGAGTVESIGIRSVGSRLVVADNTAGCLEGHASGGEGLSSAVFLHDSPGSRVERSLLCASGRSDEDSMPLRNRVATLSITGASAGILVRDNSIRATSRGDTIHSSAVRAEDCEGGKPWIVDNDVTSDAENVNDGILTAVWGAGDCHPVIDSNRRIGGLSTRAGGYDASSVRCDALGGVASRCVVSGNASIARSTQMRAVTIVQYFDTGVRCENGACAKIVKNTIVASRALSGCQTACAGRGIGIVLGAGMPLVDRNTITGGCVPNGTGIESVASAARVQNNHVSGVQNSSCTPFPTLRSAVALDVTHSATQAELDAHSNSLMGSFEVNQTLCTSGRALVMFRQATNAPTEPVGILRNNEFGATVCSEASISEIGLLADPRIVENNALAFASVAQFYRDADGNPTQTIEQVNALPDITASGNRDPNGGLRNGGTTAGAPLWDFNGKPRDAQPDIGHIER